MANRSTFPATIDTFQEKYEISATDLVNIQRYQELKLKSSRTPEEDTELNNLTTTLEPFLINAESFNKLQDAMTNIENFTKETMLNYYKYTGVYDNTKTYRILNTVSYNGDIYLALIDNVTGVIPTTDANKWLKTGNKGDKGDKGDPGLGLKFLGTYNNSYAYNVDDAVTYNNKIYYCILPSIGNLPTNTTYWTIFITSLNNASDINVVDTNNNFIATNVEDVLAEVNKKTIPYVATTGTANTYIATFNPAITSYVEGMAISVKINVDSTGASTINVNGLGAINIKKQNGNNVASGNLKTGSIYTLRYNGVNFILQGEGGSGTATNTDVLSGKTFTNDTGEFTGTMANKGAKVFIPSSSTQSDAAGYYSSVTCNPVTFDASKLLNDTIVAGTPGTMVNRSTINGEGGLGRWNGLGTFADGTGGLYFRVPQGYWDGTNNSWVIQYDADYISSNIRSGIDLFGIIGSMTEGAKIKSVQTGKTAISAMPTNITISNVNISKCMVFYQPLGYSTNYTYSLINVMPSIALTTSTNLQISGLIGSAYNLRWYVVEFEQGLTHQTISGSIASGWATSNSTISSVDITKSFCFAYLTSATDTSQQRAYMIGAYLTDATTLTVQRESGLGVVGFTAHVYTFI